MNSFVRFMCAAVVFGCMSSSFQVIAMSDEGSAYFYDVDTLHDLKSIFIKKQSLINLWKLGLIVLEDAQGKSVDMVEFIKHVEKYLSQKECELDENIMTVESVQKILSVLKELK